MYYEVIIDQFYWENVQEYVLHGYIIDQFYWENVQEYVIHGYN